MVVHGSDVKCMYGKGYSSCSRIRIIRARGYRELCARPRFQNAIAAIPRCQSEIAHGPTRTLYKVITSCNNLANGYFPANLPSYLTLNRKFVVSQLGKTDFEYGQYVISRLQ
jgi:hypothetical protein